MSQSVSGVTGHFQGQGTVRIKRVTTAYQGCRECLSAGVMVTVKCHSQVEGSWVTELDVTFRVKFHGPDQELQYGSRAHNLGQESQSDSGGHGPGN